MKIVIVGGGTVGYYLAKALLEHNHEPTVVESKKDVCSRLANNLDIPVILGDGTTIEALQEAGAAKADVLIAVSGRDEINLIACQLGRLEFHVRRTIAKANNPKNADVMRELGVDIAVSSIDAITRLKEREVDMSSIKHLISLNQGEASIVEIVLPNDFRYSGKKLSDIRLPEQMVVVSVERSGEMLIPRGNTLIFSGDKLLILTKDDAMHELKERFRLTDEGGGRGHVK